MLYLGMGFPYFDCRCVVIPLKQIRLSTMPY